MWFLHLLVDPPKRDTRQKGGRHLRTRFLKEFNLRRTKCQGRCRYHVTCVTDLVRCCDVIVLRRVLSETEENGLNEEQREEDVERRKPEHVISFALNRCSNRLHDMPLFLTGNVLFCCSYQILVLQYFHVEGDDTADEVDGEEDELDTGCDDPLPLLRPRQHERQDLWRQHQSHDRKCFALYLRQ